MSRTTLTEWEAEFELESIESRCRRGAQEREWGEHEWAAQQATPHDVETSRTSAQGQNERKLGKEAPAEVSADAQVTPRKQQASKYSSTG